ncbi:ABC transporter A family member 1 [Dorcoceras hygrometricum]|uniref:ABC transporter A family member 1 n=1 Tax=Dorcoceras hygrometricum TaxID=472368 RepID=A0A2Z7CQ89_9LAMI|nr:ABC transporter A family member 1 [Dorcoceras hygrometricum]
MYPFSLRHKRTDVRHSLQAGVHRWLGVLAACGLLDRVAAEAAVIKAGVHRWLGVLAACGLLDRVAAEAAVIKDQLVEQLVDPMRDPLPVLRTVYFPNILKYTQLDGSVFKAM